MTSRPLGTSLSLLLLTLGVGMIALLLHLDRHVQQQMTRNIRDIDMVVGAKGSPLQLILSAVYHVDAPTGNIALSEARKLKRNRLVAATIPLSYGDSHEGFRIVGTDHQYPELYQATMANGRLWEAPFEVTLGATVAHKLNLNIGDVFEGAHGLSEGGEIHGEHSYRVVGVLNRTNSVMDQLILTATESVWNVHDHGAEEEGHSKHEDHIHEHDHDEAPHAEHKGEREITAMLVKFRSPLAMVQLPRMVNEKTNMQAAVPVLEIDRLFGLMGVGVDALSAIAWVVMAVSGFSVFISLFSALKAREYEMALMRTYGASRWQLVGLVLQEGLLLIVIGFILGILFSRLGLFLVSGLLEDTYHYTFSAWAWLVEEGWLLVASLGIGLLASLIPAVRAFRVNISQTLIDA